MKTSPLRQTIRFFSLTLALSIGLTVSTMSHAEAPGGPDCGWGNMLFQGDKGVVPHTAAYLTNGLTSFNAFFGILFGTNGCETDGVLSYSGTPMLGLNEMLDELAEDIARGSGEALTTLSVAMKINKEDRPHFDEVLHENFAQIFTHEDINATEVMDNIAQVMSDDKQLKHYLG